MNRPQWLAFYFKLKPKESGNVFKLHSYWNQCPKELQSIIKFAVTEYIKEDFDFTYKDLFLYINDYGNKTYPKMNFTVSHKKTGHTFEFWLNNGKYSYKNHTFTPKQIIPYILVDGK